MNKAFAKITFPDKTKIYDKRNQYFFNNMSHINQNIPSDPD